MVRHSANLAPVQDCLQTALVFVTCHPMPRGRHFMTHGAMLFVLAPPARDASRRAESAGSCAEICRAASLRKNCSFSPKLDLDKLDHPSNDFLLKWIFCSIAAGDAPGHILWHDRDILVILSLEGHPLVLPLRHLASLDDLDDALGASMMSTAQKVARALRTETGCEGASLVLSDGVAAGQDVLHLHLHVKPRWRDDHVVLNLATATAPEANRSRLAAALTVRLAAIHR